MIFSCDFRGFCLGLISFIFSFDLLVSALHFYPSATVHCSNVCDSSCRSFYALTMYQLYASLVEDPVGKRSCNDAIWFES